MALYGFLCDTEATVQSISGATLPMGTLPGLTDRALCGLISTSFEDFGGNIAKIRVADNPTATLVHIVAPTANQSVIRVYAFSSSTVLTNLWQVPDGDGNPIVPIGTTFGTINDAAVACSNAGCILFNSAGMLIS
jgi:hypothetical protein